MKKVSKVAASVLATCAISAGIVAPAANAVSVEVNGNTCTFTLNSKEALNYTENTFTLTRSKANEAVRGYTAEMKRIEEGIAAYKREVSVGRMKQSEAQYWSDSYKASRADFLNMMPAYRACADGQNLSESSHQMKVALTNPADGKPNEAGIGVIAAGVIVGVIGLIAVVLPQIKQFLPAEIASMIP